MGTIRSSKSIKTLAIVTGTFVVQFDRETPQPDHADVNVITEKITDQLRALGARGIVVPVGEIEIRIADNRFEIRQPVTYGPVLGGYASDIWKHLESLTLDPSVHELDLWQVTRHEITDAELPTLAARINDLELPIAYRKRLGNALATLDARRKPAIAETPRGITNPIDVPVVLPETAAPSEPTTTPELPEWPAPIESTTTDGAVEAVA